MIRLLPGRLSVDQLVIIFGKIFETRRQAALVKCRGNAFDVACISPAYWEYDTNTQKCMFNDTTIPAEATPAVPCNQRTVWDKINYDLALRLRLQRKSSANDCYMSNFGIEAILCRRVEEIPVMSFWRRPYARANCCASDTSKPHRCSPSLAE